MVTLEPMEDGERGLVVNTASVAAQDGQIGQAAYSASKGGVYAMTLPIARDLAQEGIRVQHHPARNHVDADDGRHGPEGSGQLWPPRFPSPADWARPADYASLVLELARNVYINGECIQSGRRNSSRTALIAQGSFAPR